MCAYIFVFDVFAFGEAFLETAVDRLNDLGLLERLGHYQRDKDSQEPHVFS